MQILNIANILIRIALYSIIFSIRANERKLDWKNRNTMLRMAGSVLVISVYSITLFFLPTPFSRMAQMKHLSDVLIVLGLFAGYVFLLVTTIMWTLHSCKKAD